MLPRTPNSPTNLDAVIIPEAFTVLSSLCPVTSIVPAISTLPFASRVPAKVDTPDTFKLSSSVCPSTSIDPVTSRSLLNVETPVTLMPPARTSSPTLAVAIPTESTLVTSS